MHPWPVHLSLSHDKTKTAMSPIINHPRTQLASKVGGALTSCGSEPYILGRVSQSRPYIVGSAAPGPSAKPKPFEAHTATRNIEYHPYS